MDVRNTGWLPPMLAQTGDQMHNLGGCPDREWNPPLLWLQDDAPTHGASGPGQDPVSRWRLHGGSDFPKSQLTAHGGPFILTNCWGPLRPRTGAQEMQAELRACRWGGGRRGLLQQIGTYYLRLTLYLFYSNCLCFEQEGSWSNPNFADTETGREGGLSRLGDTLSGSGVPLITYTTWSDAAP